MSPTRKFLLFVVGASALAGVAACTIETDLNPQPLPPDQETGRGTSGGSNTGDGTGFGGQAPTTGDATEDNPPPPEPGGVQADAGAKNPQLNRLARPPRVR